MMKNITDSSHKFTILIVLMFLCNGICKAQDNFSCFYARIDSVSQDSVYIAIHNQSSSPVALFTGFIHSMAGRLEMCKVDQMAYLHRYDPERGSYILSFIPLKPFIRYSSHMPVRHLDYTDEPSFPLTYEFEIIPPDGKFIYPVSKAAIFKKEYIMDYHPNLFPFYNVLAMKDQKDLSKYEEYRPYVGKLKISRAPDRQVNAVTIEFAIYLAYDLILPDSDSRNWTNYYMRPKECNMQLNDFITVSVPVLW